MNKFYRFTTVNSEDKSSKNLTLVLCTMNLQDACVVMCL